MATDSGPQESPPPWHAAAAGASEQQLLLGSPSRERRRRRALPADEEEEGEREELPEMARDSGPQEPPLPWLAAATGAPDQQLLLGSPARERCRRRALLADEEEGEQADAAHHGVAAGHAIAPTAERSSEETTTGPATVLLLPSEVVESFSKEALGRLCKGSSAPATLLLPLERARAQIVSPTETSAEHLMSYLQDPKSVKLLAEKTREIWKVSYIDGMEECFTALPMHLLVAKEKISAPTKRLHCNSVVGEVLRGSSEETKTGPATGLLLVPSEVVGSFSKEVLGRLCKGSSAPATLLLPLEHARAQAVSPTDNSSEHLMSYLQDPKSVRILAEKTREIWKVSYIDGVEECFTALPMLLELQSDQHSPRSSHTAASAQDIDRQQLAACSKGNCHIQETDECSRGDTERQMLDASKNRCQEVQIFIRHCSGQVVLMVNLDESSEHMMNLFEKETKMKLVHHYFKYGNSRIDPNCTLLSYGVGRNATVDAYSRLLGGSRTSLEEYFHVKRNDILMEVTLPDEKISLEMTVEGCRIMSSWLSCFMWAFSQGKSWGGSFTLKDFYVLDGHVRIGNEKGLHKGHVSGAIGRDIERLVKHLKEILCRHKSNLVSEYPPFLKSLTAFLDKRKTVKTISESEKLFIETHISCTTSSSWGMLLYKLHRRYLGLTQAEKSQWDDAIKSAVLPHGWRSSLSEMIVFKDMFEDAKKGGRKYGTSNIGAFTLMRDTAMHGLDDLGNENTNQKRYQNADKLALMVPAHMLDFLPNIIEKLINKNIDISAELFAAKIRCSCQACAPSF